MKVLVITYYWPPSGGAGVQRWLKFVKYLRDFGWDPIVYVPENPEYPSEDFSFEKDIPENTVPIPTRTKNPPVATKKSTEKSNSTAVANSTKTTTGKTNAKGDIKKENATGDGRGNAAIGNLLKGRGTKSGSQGNGTGPGNYGDPLGGDGDGNSLIGIDRKLTGFIPGTMGRGGAQPNHDCQASGSITISYTVDKSGKVTSARRQSGNSDPCLSSTAVSWVKQYVKAEAANVASKGTYKITF